MQLDCPGRDIRSSYSIFTMADTKTAVATSSPYNDTMPHFPQNPSNGTHIDMERYRATVPLWKRVWQHSLTQMMLLSVQAFCGPAMSDAITGMYFSKIMRDQVFTLNATNISKDSVVVDSQLLKCRIFAPPLHTPFLPLVCVWQSPTT